MIFEESFAIHTPSLKRCSAADKHGRLTDLTAEPNKKCSSAEIWISYYLLKGQEGGF